MNLLGINVGDTVQFVVKVQNSGVGQSIQNVFLKVTEITPTYIRGINALRSLESENLTYRTYRRENMVQNTLWKLVG